MTAAASYLVSLLSYLLPSKAFSTWSQVTLLKSQITWLPCLKHIIYKARSTLPTSMASSHSIFSPTQCHPVTLTHPLQVPWMLFLSQDLWICCTLCLTHSLPSSPLADSYWTFTFWLKIFFLSVPQLKIAPLCFLLRYPVLPFCSMSPGHELYVYFYAYLFNICLITLEAPWGQGPSLFCSLLCPYHLSQSLRIS